MTCIVGLVEKNAVYMGGDSAVSYSYVTQTLVAKKVFRNGPFLIGYSGTVRSLQLLQHAFTPPEHPSEMNSEKYFTTLFADALRTVLKDAGQATKQNEQEGHPGYFLIGYHGRLFTLGSDYSLSEIALGYDSIGSGHEVALGAMHATRHMALCPKKRIKLALKAASAFCHGVRGPFIIEALEDYRK